ncbi:DUF6064 family protein [Natronocella acetinitrilica]|nr:DUF6064 family protein [Natronocella acetinitrilica]
MGDWLSYRLEDFIPFTAEVYFRLIERINESFWPLQLLMVFLGLVAVLLAWRGWRRFGLALVAGAWLVSGFVFHLQYYAEINVLAGNLAVLFFVQAVLMLTVASFGAGGPSARRSGGLRTVVGVAIAAFGSAAYPLLAPLTGNGWRQAEVFALHPDPTAIVTLGFLLIALRGSASWLVYPIPLLWCLITTLTLIPLQVGWALLPLGIATITVLGLAAAAFEDRFRTRNCRAS